MTQRPLKYTPRRRAMVLDVLSATANVASAARRSGVTRRTLYNWRERYADFAAEWDEAIEHGLDALEDVAMRRAVEGVKRTVFYRGKPCGEVRYYSDALLMFLLRSRRPWRYAYAGELARRQAKAEPPVVVDIVHFGDRESFEDRRAALKAAQARGDTDVPPGPEALRGRLAGGTGLATTMAAPVEGWGA